jgi:hypothetical protein
MRSVGWPKRRTAAGAQDLRVVQGKVVEPLAEKRAAAGVRGIQTFARSNEQPPDLSGVVRCY